MELKKYLMKHRICPTPFSYECGVGVSTIYRILRGQKVHHRVAEKISKFTEYQVSYLELRGEEEHEERK